MNPEDYEELKKRNEEREEEDRKAIQEMLEREKIEQEQIKKRLKEREEEDRVAIEQMKEREIKEQEEIKKRLEEREKEDRIAFEQMQKREEEEQKEFKKRQEEEKKELEKQYSEKVFASLQPPTGSTAVNTHSGTIPVYYVIIGRGPAAIINHTTLRQTEFGKKRIAGLPVMHIGFANPWTKYMHHGMGQPPHLLNLPGFKNHPAHLLKDEGLDSREFARCVEEEYKRLESHYGANKVITQESWVVWIQTDKCEKLATDTKNELKKDGMNDEFISKIEKKLVEGFKSKTVSLRLLAMNAKPADQLTEEDIFFIYASYIDICTGPGRPVVFPPGKGDTEQCKKARTAPWLSPETWKDQWGYELLSRKVLNGVDAIRDEVRWKSNERVCVTAGGGVGLNAAERARNEDCKLDWFGRTSLMDTFANPRNDTILRHPSENRLLKPGESKALKWEKDDQIIPCSEKLRYGYGATLEDTGILGSKVEVTLTGNKNSKIKDFFNKQVSFFSTSMWDCSSEYQKACDQQPSKLYDRLVIPNGQASRSLGHAYFFARHLTLITLNANDGRMIALKTADEKVRVLGAAAQTYDKYGFAERNNADAAGKKMWLWWDSLPVSAVPDGFIFSGINIAVANEYFAFGKINNNVNTATEDELSALLINYFGDVGDEITKLIIQERKRNKNNGYADIEEVIKMLKNNIESLKSGSADEYIRSKLATAYKPSQESQLL